MKHFYAARSERYDIELLRHRFRASFEQTCHRLATVRRPGAEVNSMPHAADRHCRKHFEAIQRVGHAICAVQWRSRPRWNVFEGVSDARTHPNATFGVVGWTRIPFAIVVRSKNGGGFRSPLRSTPWHWAARSLSRTRWSTRRPRFEEQGRGTEVGLQVPPL